MGTRFELVLAGHEPARLRALSEDAFEEIERLDRELSRFRRGSLISYVNDHAVSRPVEVDEETFALIDAALSVFRASQGAFDPTQGPRMRAHGLWSGEDSTTECTGADAIELDFDRRYVTFRRPIELDFGGIAKGHAIDAAVDIMRTGRAEGGLLHGGTSSVRAFGRPGAGETWRIALANAMGAPYWCAVLNDAALGVSAPHGRTDGVFGHVIDPHTGSPTVGVELAAVVGPLARTCDAWSTALVVDPRLDLPRGYTGLVVESGQSVAEARRFGHDPNVFARL